MEPRRRATIIGCSIIVLITVIVGAWILDPSARTGKEMFHVTVHDYTSQTTMTAAAQPQTPILLWKLTNDTKDYSGNNYDGILYSSGNNTSYSGGAIALGQGKFVRNANVALLNPQNITVSVEVQQLTTRDYFMHTFALFGQHGMTVYVNPGTYDYYYKLQDLNNKTATGAIGNLGDGAVHTITLSYDGHKVRSFLDFKPKASTISEGQIKVSDKSVFLGNTGTNSTALRNYYEGYARNFAVFDVPATEDNIQTFKHTS